MILKIDKTLLRLIIMEMPESFLSAKMYNHIEDCWLIQNLTGEISLMTFDFEDYEYKFFAHINEKDNSKLYQILTYLFMCLRHTEAIKLEKQDKNIRIIKANETQRPN